MISAIKGSLPVASQGPQPDIFFFGFVELLVAVVATASFSGTDVDPSRGFV